MKKSIPSIFIFICAIFALLICPQVGWAGYQSDSTNLPPLGGHYISPPEWQALYAPGIIVKDPIHSAFTQAVVPPPPGQSLTHSFGARVDMMISADGGQTFQPVWANGNVTVHISCTEPNIYVTEMLQLDISGGSLPPGVFIRESPTLPSVGQTVIRGGGGGGYQIDSFFDIYTEISLDGGQSWSPDTLAPAHMTLAEGGICDNPVGDLNADDVVDWSDIGLFAAQWLQVACDDANGWCSGADLDGSADVDFSDYAILAADWQAVGNCSPLVDAGLDQTITLPAIANLAGAVTDDGLPDAVTALWTKQSGPNDVTFGDASNPVTTASFVEAGVYVLRLTADDSDLTTYDEVTITVNPGIVNLPPEVSTGDDQEISMMVGATWANTNLDGTVSDDGLPSPPADVNTLWTVISGPNDVTFGDANQVDTTASFNGVGVYVLRLTADDSLAQSYDEVQITVVQNIAPTVDAGNDVTITYPTLSVSLDGTVTDDGLPNPPGAVTTLWTKESGTGTVTFADASAVDTTATFPDAGGVFVLRLTANDGDASVYDEVQITVVGKPAWSESANYYVDGFTGSDTNPGNSNQPFKTVAKAATMANTSNKKVLVWGGGGGGRPATQTYIGQVTLSNSGTSSNVITYRRDPTSGEAIIDANSSSNGGIYSNGRAYITVDGFTVTNGQYGVYLFGDAADNVTIKNCRIKGNTRYGIYDREGDNLKIENCAVYLNNTSGGSYAQVYIWGSTGSVTGCQILSCTINGTLSPNQGKYGVQALTAATIDLIRDCIIVNHKMSGGDGVLEDTGATVTAISYCDAWNNTTQYSTGCPAPTSSITSDPKFVDPANGDFHLQASSPCKGTGSGGIDMGYRYIDTAL